MANQGLSRTPPYSSKTPTGGGREEGVKKEHPAQNDASKLNGSTVSRPKAETVLNIPEGDSPPATALNQRTQTSVPSEGVINKSNADTPSVQDLIDGFKSCFSKKELPAVRESLEDWHKHPLKNETLDSIQTQFLYDSPCENPRVALTPAPIPSTEELASKGITINEWYEQISQQNKDLQTPFIDSFVKSGFLQQTEGQDDKKRYNSVILPPDQFETLKESLPKQESITVSERDKPEEQYHAERKKWGYE
ncbi:hypothetical protein [Endozoicomonas sp.]|uniref:hypothetical protein n=1 Tax=Endozoicomonas sp. TaxID=1892382 RepID=UPI0028857697|nr:hypothetical protein [Endozoicomonas sp.]